MPITVQHQPPMTLVGQAAYQSALARAYQDERRKAQELALRAAQLREQQRQFNLGLADKTRARWFSGQQQQKQRQFEVSRTKFLADQQQQQQQRTFEQADQQQQRTFEQADQQQQTSQLFDLNRLGMANTYATQRQEAGFANTASTAAKEYAFNLQSQAESAFAKLAPMLRQLPTGDTAIEKYGTLSKAYGGLSADFASGDIDDETFAAKTQEILGELSRYNWQEHLPKNPEAYRMKGTNEMFYTDPATGQIKSAGSAQMTDEELKADAQRNIQMVDFKDGTSLKVSRDPNTGRWTEVARGDKVDPRDKLEAISQKTSEILEQKLSAYPEPGPDGVRPGLTPVDYERLRLEAKEEAITDVERAYRPGAAVQPPVQPPVQPGAAPPQQPPPQQPPPVPPPAQQQPTPAAPPQLPQFDASQPKGSHDNPHLAANMREASAIKNRIQPGDWIYVLSLGVWVKYQPVSGRRSGEARTSARTSARRNAPAGLP